MGGGWGLHGLDEEDCERKSKGRRGDDCKLIGGGGGGGEREERHREFRAQQAHLIINFAKRGRLEMEGCKNVKEEEETTVNSGTAGVWGKTGPSSSTLLH